MEKIEAIREYCIERAIEVLQKRIDNLKVTAKQVVTFARKLEDYILEED